MIQQYTSTINILLAVGIVLFIAIPTISFIIGYKTSEIWPIIIGLIFTVVIAPVLLLNVLSMETKSYMARIDAGYKVYIDGVEVDPNNIDISDYKVSCDDVNNKMMLTHH